MENERRVERHYNGLPWYEKIVLWFTVLLWIAILAPFWAWSMLTDPKGLNSWRRKK